MVFIFMILQSKPPGFAKNVYSFSFDVNTTEEKVWQWLNDPKTFTDTQYWPWRVEFYSPDPTIESGFHEKVLTNHHGPLINFAGVLTKIENNKYRDLQYNYGSYAISLRWFRPYRLEFRTEAKDDKTRLQGTLSAYVKPSLTGIWTKLQKFFWSGFQRWAKKSIARI